MTAPPLTVQLLHALFSQGRVMAAVVPGMVLTMLHSTMLDLGKVDLIDALDSDRYRIQWLMGTYLLGSAAGMALTGFCAGRFGLRYTYLAAVLLFGLAGGQCGLVAEVIWMAPLRLLQGLGLGLLISGGMVLIWRAFPDHKELAMAVYAMSVYLAAVLGTPLGGLLTAWLGWRALFLVLWPLALAVLLTAWWTLPHDSPPEHPPRFDFLGLALLLAWLIPLNVVLDLGQYLGWLSSPFIVSWLVALVVCFTAFVAWGILAPHPLIDLRPFALRNFSLAISVKGLFSINLYVLLGMLSGYMIDLRGYQWWQGALIILPAFGTMFAAIVLGARFGTEANRKLRMLAGLGGMALATWLIAEVDLYTNKLWLALHLAGWAAAAGLLVGPVMLTLFEGLTTEQTLRIAGIFNLMRALPTYIVGSLLVILLTQRSDAHFDYLRQAITRNRPIVAQAFRQPERHFTDRGSPAAVRGKQAHALLGQWVRANASAFALQTVLKYLALGTAAGLVLIGFIRVPPSDNSSCAHPREASAPSPAVGPPVRAGVAGVGPAG